MAIKLVPEGYTQLEYIEQPLGNSGYIKTGIDISNALDWEITAESSDNISNIENSYGCFFGARIASKNSDLQLTTYKANNNSFNGTFRVGSSNEYNAHLPNKEKFTAKLEGTTYTIGDTTTTNLNRNLTVAREIYIFALNNNNNPVQFGHYKLYSLKFVRNGILLRHFIPCINPDSVVGLYDRITKGFFTSANAVTFTAGPVKTITLTAIAEKAVEVNYIKEDLRSAINEHYGTEELIYSDGLVEYANAIDNIDTSNYTLPTEPKAVNFIDYDGTLLYVYTAQEFQAMEGLPRNPWHSGLVAQGWNWTREEIISYLNRAPRIDITQNYITNDGSTRLYIKKTGQLNQQVQIYQSAAYGVEIDWGDNTTSAAQSGTGIKTFTHTYSAQGNYVIRIIPKAGTFDFGNTPTGTNNLQNGVFGNPQSYETLVNELYKVELGSNLVRLSSCAFQIAHNLETISIPKEIKEFRHRCLASCYHLKHISIPDEATLLAYSLQSVLEAKYLCFPPNLTVDGATQVFRYWYGLEYVMIPDSVTGVLPSGMFYDCQNLKNVRLSESLTRLAQDSFRNCFSLQKIKIPSGVVAFCTSNTYTDYSCTLGGCWSITSLDIPEGVTMIHAYFNQDGYALCFLTLPSTLTVIGANAFKTHNTRWIISRAATPPAIQSSSFYNNTSMLIYVPYSEDHSIQTAYQEATNWSTFAANIKELDENGNIPEES